MERAGEKLRRARERLKLTYRDVAVASKEIAQRRGSTEFAIPLSRLADIENNGRLPTMFRLYTLCAIYRLNLHEVLRWYGVPVESLAAESLRVGLAETHPLEITPDGHASIPYFLEGGVNPEKTTFLSHIIRRGQGSVEFYQLSGPRATPLCPSRPGRPIDVSHSAARIVAVDR